MAESHVLFNGPALRPFENGDSKIHRKYIEMVAFRELVLNTASPYEDLAQLELENGMGIFYKLNLLSSTMQGTKNPLKSR